MRYSMKTIYNAKPGDVYWAASDVGWVVGHSYIVYAPLLHGCTTVVYEGKPVKTPDPGAFWRMIEEHKINHFFTAPTAFRAVRKEDPDAEFLKKYDISSLKGLFLAGERLDPPTYEWLQNILDVPITDHWWQTETGWAIAGNPMGLEPHQPKSGSATLPSPGYNVTVLDEEGYEVSKNTQGNIAIKLPLPPSCLPTLWGDHDRFKASYLDQFPGYYSTSDGGYLDEDGYVFVMGRTDDNINVAGHRLSTGEMEELIGSHAAVAECAVVGIDDELRGQVPVGFVVLKDGVTAEPESIEQDLILLIRQEIGAVAYFRQAAIVARLPKTRSGKILRKTIRRLAVETDVPVPPTIDDPKIMTELLEAMQSKGIGQFSNNTQIQAGLIPLGQHLCPLFLMTSTKLPCILLAQSNSVPIARKYFYEYLRPENLTVWEPPQVMQIERWLLQLAHQALLFEQVTFPENLSRVLQKREEQLVWEEILREDLKDSKDFLQILPLVRTVQETHRLWQIHLSSGQHNFPPNPTWERFTKWQTTFTSRCEKEGWWTEADLVFNCLKWIKEGQIPIPEEFWFVGFRKGEDLLLNELRQALQSRNSTFAIGKYPDQNLPNLLPVASQIRSLSFELRLTG